MGTSYWKWGPRHQKGNRNVSSRIQSKRRGKPKKPLQSARRGVLEENLERKKNLEKREASARNIYRSLLNGEREKEGSCGAQSGTPRRKCAKLCFSRRNENAHRRTPILKTRFGGGSSSHYVEGKARVSNKNRSRNIGGRGGSTDLGVELLFKVP